MRDIFESSVRYWGISFNERELETSGRQAISYFFMASRISGYITDDVLKAVEEE